MNKWESVFGILVLFKIIDYLRYIFVKKKISNILFFPILVLNII